MAMSAAFFPAYAAVSAQSVLLPADTLGSALIVASRTPTSAVSATSTQHLDTAGLRRRGITDTGDALRRLAGVNLRDYGGAGGLKTVSVRGLGAAHTTVCYDGLAVSDAQQGQIDLRRFSIDRLAGLALHIGGNETLLCPVRNLGAATLKLTALSANQRRHGIHGTAALRLASFSTVNPSLQLGVPTGRRGTLTAAADFFYALNNYPFTVNNGVATHRERRTNSRMQSWTGEISHQWLTPRGGRLDTKAYYYNNQRRLPGQVILYTNKNNERLAEQNFFAQSRWQQRFGRYEVFAAGKWNWQESRYTDLHAQWPGGALHRNYIQREAYATTGIAARWGNFHAAYAADFAHTTLSSNQVSAPRAARSQLLQSLSLRWQAHGWQLTARAVGNLSADKVSGRENSPPPARRLSPEATALWKAADFRTRHGGRYTLRLRAGYKELFRLPTFSEAYFYHLGEQNLQPEQTRQFSAGLTLHAAPAPWWPMLLITADAYANRVKHRIMSIPYNLFVWNTFNMGEVRARGLDLCFESHFRLGPRHSLLPALNYSLQRAADRSNPASADFGKTPAYTPRHSGAASVAYENPWLNAVAHLTFSSERWSTNAHLPSTHLPAYAEFGFGLYRLFRLGPTRCEARADLLNAFDRQYEVVRRYPMPGRAYKLTFIVNF